jgi:hypothetical protein
MRDFYRLPVLSEEDETFIRLFVEQPGAHPLLRKLNIGWLHNVAATSRLRRFLERRDIKDDTNIQEAIHQVEIQTEESFHSHIETNAIRLLDALRRGSGDLWQQDNDAMDFAFFLALQHLRTRKVRDKFVAGFEEESERQSALRRWPVLRLILATNLGWSLFSERHDWNLRVLSASGHSSFITSDQPTQNLINGKGHDDLALFYPISPHRAVILEKRGNESPVGDNDDLTDAEIGQLNRKIYDYSHEQVFANDLATLTRLGLPNSNCGRNI